MLGMTCLAKEDRNAPVTRGHVPTTLMKTQLCPKLSTECDHNRKTNSRHVPTTPSLGPHYILTTLITFLRGSYYAHHHVCTAFIRLVLRPYYVKEVPTTSPLRAYYTSTARFQLM